MASSTPPATSTVHSSLLALTTPFVPPPNCGNIFSTTSTITSYAWNNFTKTTLTVVYSDPSNSRFTQCQPLGWDKVVPTSRFHFSPAVCPDQWTAYELQAVYVDMPTSSRWATTAFCCASGHYLRDPVVSLQSLDTLACVSAIGVQPTLSSPLSSVPLFPSGMQIHNAYQISWDSTDKVTLSPTPPDFSYGCSATLRTWVPGESVGKLPCNNKTEGGGFGNGSLYVFIIIGIPIIVVALIATCCGVHFRNARKGPRDTDQPRPRGHREAPLASGRTELDVQLGNVKT